MSYPFKFSPLFLRRKREILSLTATPAIELPPEVEAALISRAQVYKGAGTGAGQLWLACMVAIKPLLWKAAGISTLTSLCASAATLAAMELLKAGKSTSVLVGLAFAYFGASVGMQMATFCNSRFRNWASHAVQALLVRLVSQKLLALSSRAEARQSSGNLKVLITSDTQRVAEFVDNFIRNFIPAVIAIAVVLPLLVHFTGKAGLAGVIIMTTFIPISFGLNWISSYFQRKGQAALDSLASLLGEWVKNIRLIRYLSWDESFQKEIVLKLKFYMSHSTAQHLMACLIFGLSVTWWMVSVVGVFVVARWTHTPLDLLGFFGSLWLLTFLSAYFTHLPNTIRLFGLANPSIQRIAQLLKEEEQIDLFEPQTTGALDFLAKPVKVTFQNVSFAYSGSNCTIQNLSVNILLDQKLAIVGEVASGKTTFLRLLCGDVPPTEGKILVEFEDGKTGSLWQKAIHQAYRKHLAWVPQEPFISSDPLSANISLISSSEESALVEAAYWAELEADLLSFPNGIHEEIGEGGVNLSGGQKQRLNMARAYYSNRAYLVLDDALSAVDSRTEVALMKRLERYDRGFVLVTHRTDELMRVEKVLVMKNGNFIEAGAPKALAADPSSNFSRVLFAYRIEVVDV